MDASVFDQVQAILAGARVPREELSLKILHFMLEDPRGCDATVTPDRFRIQYGWHLSYHHYFLDIAPGVVSWLCAAAPDGYLAAGALPWWGGAPGAWSYGPRRVWFDASPARVVIMIRDATGTPAGARLPPPPSIEPPPEYLPGDHPCPHCGVVPERFRRLRDGSLVCFACGRSSG